ncbi:MAG: Nif3-like dinuclear metal center hexameric protein [Burkholderiales bacterium]|nr:Nif3-like dinuclear metal center hexameric protein [Burkholderiales bacterium]
MDRQALSEYLEKLLPPAAVEDYCPNGLQVEGRTEIRRIVSGVTASQPLIDAAAESGADALLVHHGLFWKGDSGRLTGYRRARVARLIHADINLYAFHLPLDIHPELGNNTQLGLRLGLERTGSLDRAGLLAVGDVPGAAGAGTTLGEFARQVARALGREPLVVGDPAQPLRRAAWCTGGGQRYIEDAWPRADVFITGEVSEQTVHVARECGIGLVCAGHHATERYGVQAVGEHLAREHGLEHRFVDIDNPA